MPQTILCAHLEVVRTKLRMLFEELQDLPQIPHVDPSAMECQCERFSIQRRVSRVVHYIDHLVPNA